MSREYTIGEVLDEAARRLASQGISEERRNAQLLLQHILKIETAELLTKLDEILPADLLSLYSAVVVRRLNREPLQYITRRAEFWGHRLYVDQRVLIPRPETEHLLEAILEDYPDRGKALAIADIGTGSGCIGASLAREYSRAKVFATDIDPGALEVAAINASRLNVSNRVMLLKGDLLEPLEEIKSPRAVNIIVSNPPYISTAEALTLEPEVIKAEPRHALVAGTTGLEIYERMVPQVADSLRRGGRVYFECGYRQARSIAELISAEDRLEYVRSIKDHQGIPRVVVGQKRS